MNQFQRLKAIGGTLTRATFILSLTLVISGCGTIAVHEWKAGAGWGELNQSIPNASDLDVMVVAQEICNQKMPGTVARLTDLGNRALVKGFAKQWRYDCEPRPTVSARPAPLDKDHENEVIRLRAQAEAAKQKQQELEEQLQQARKQPATPVPAVVSPITDRLSLDASRVKCAELGFKPSTEGFGKCVLQLSK
jgi:hypothetical protein